MFLQGQSNANTGLYELRHCSLFSSSCMMLISPEEIFCALQKMLNRLLNDSVLSESCECCSCKGWWKDSLVSLTASFFSGTFLWREEFEPFCFYQGRVTLLLWNSRQLVSIGCFSVCTVWIVIKWWFTINWCQVMNQASSKY